MQQTKNIMKQWQDIKAETRPRSFSELPFTVKSKYYFAAKTYNITLYACGSVAEGGYYHRQLESTKHLKDIRRKAMGKTENSDYDICSPDMNDAIRAELTGLGFDVIPYVASRALLEIPKTEHD